jgi:hypothetical protein
MSKRTRSLSPLSHRSAYKNILFRRSVSRNASQSVFPLKKRIKKTIMNIAKLKLIHQNLNDLLVRVLFVLM